MSDATPAALAARRQRAQAYIAARNLPAAIAELEAMVAAEPRLPEVWLTLARLAQGEQRFRAAVEYARNAAAAVHESGDLRLLADAALLLQTLGESLLAVRLIRLVDPARPEIVATADRVGQCLGLADFHAEALQVLDTAMRLREPTPALSFMRATTLRHLGRGPEATQEYQRCLALAPHHAATMLMLAQHDRRSDAAGQLARIRQALANAGGREDLDTATLCHALFVHLDALGEHAAAWDALMRGAAIKRRSLAWQPQRDADRIAALREACQGGFPERTNGSADAPLPIFIVGQPRTGTTVLERILGNHSQVASAGELNDFHLQLCWQADLLVEHVDPLLARACADLDFAAIGRGYRQRSAWRAQGRRFLVDKLPGNFWYAGFIRKALPEARIICLLRDPLDTCLSNLKELFAGSVYPYSYEPLEAAAHHVQFRQMLQYWDEVMPGAVLTVRYEDLVRDPATTARAVMTHCGLPFEPACIDLTRNAAPSATASSSQVREGIHTRGVGAWRRYADQLASVRTYLQAHLPIEAFAAAMP